MKAHKVPPLVQTPASIHNPSLLARWRLTAGIPLCYALGQHNPAIWNSVAGEFNEQRCRDTDKTKTVIKTYYLIRYLGFQSDTLVPAFPQLDLRSPVKCQNQPTVSMTGVPTRPGRFGPQVQTVREFVFATLWRYQEHGC